MHMQMIAFACLPDKAQAVLRVWRSAPCLPASMSSASGEMDRGDMPLMVLSDLNGVWYHPPCDGMRYGCPLAGNLPQMPSMVAQSVHVA